MNITKWSIYIHEQTNTNVQQTTSQTNQHKTNSIKHTIETQTKQIIQYTQQTITHIKHKIKTKQQKQSHIIQ